MDVGINFNVAKYFRKSIDSIIFRSIFNIFKFIWINIYFELFDFVIYDYGINFNLIEFKSFFRLIRIILKFIFIKIYYLIEKIKRFYYFFRRIYEIIIEKYSKLNNEDRF